MIPFPTSTADRRHLQPTSRRTHRLAAFCALLLCFAFASAAFAGPYCAFAFSRATGRYGHGEGYDSRGGAQSRALVECGAYDARIVGWCKNGYLALAVGGDGSYGTGLGNDINQAKRRALRNCQSPNAHIVYTVWSGVY